jgi:hypothetical protein
MELQKIFYGGIGFICLFLTFIFLFTKGNKGGKKDV